MSQDSEQYEYNDECEYVDLMCEYFTVLTNSTDQRPSWETNSLSATKEIPCISMFHCAFFNSISDKHQHMHFFTFKTVLV